jgi:hypothetical protein
VVKTSAQYAAGIQCPQRDRGDRRGGRGDGAHLSERGCIALTFGGYGADDDIVVASVRAYLAALNRMMAVTGDAGGHSRKAQVATVTCLSAAWIYETIHIVGVYDLG